MKKAVVIGASSGIGKALAEKLSAEGVVLGLAARREELLVKLRDGLPGLSYIKKIDAADSERANMLLKDLIREMGRVDTVFICSGKKKKQLMSILRGLCLVQTCLSIILSKMAKAV